MSNVSLLLTSYAINAAWQVAALCAAAWILARLLHRTGPEVQHRIWVAALIFGTLVPITPMLRFYFVGEAAPVNTFAPTVSIPGVPTAPLDSGLALPVLAIDLIAGLYAAALLFFAVRLCRMIGCTIMLRRNAEPVPLEPECRSLWDRTKERFRVRDAALLYSPWVSGPVTTGLSRPAVLVPSTFFATHSPTEFLAAAGHECAHIRRRDFSKNLFYEIIGLFTAFHPVSWFIKSQIAQTREMICDQTAADSLLTRQSYALSLLQLASKVPRPGLPAASHALGIFDTKTLERRIMKLNSTNPIISKTERYFTAFGALLLLFVCVASTALMTRSVSAQTSGQKTSATPDLSCTYWHKNQTYSLGTCGVAKNDPKDYRCYLNDDPSQHQKQSGCEWKVQRALAAQKKK